MRVVIHQRQSIRRDVMVMGLLLLFALLTLVVLLLPGKAG